MASVIPSVAVPVVVLEHVLYHSPQCTDMSITHLYPSGLYWVDFYDAQEERSKYGWMVMDPRGGEVRRGIYVEDENGDQVMETEEELEWSLKI